MPWARDRESLSRAPPCDDDAAADRARTRSRRASRSNHKSGHRAPEEPDRKRAAVDPGQAPARSMEQRIHYLSICSPDYLHAAGRCDSDVRGAPSRRALPPRTLCASNGSAGRDTRSSGVPGGLHAPKRRTAFQLFRSARFRFGEWRRRHRFRVLQRPRIAHAVNRCRTDQYSYLRDPACK